jgi:hypothetical protein
MALAQMVMRPIPGRVGYPGAMPPSMGGAALPQPGVAAPGSYVGGTNTPNPIGPGTPAHAAIMKRLAKAQASGAAGRKLAKQQRRGVVSAPNDPSGTGGVNDPAWGNLASLYKNGLPG